MEQNKSGAPTYEYTQMPPANNPNGAIPPNPSNQNIRPRMAPPRPRFREAILSDKSWFAMAGLFFAILYAVCLYDNLRGIGHGIFLVGAFVIMLVVAKKLQLKIKPLAVFYFVMLILCQVSIGFTTSLYLQFGSRVLSIILIPLIVIEQFYETKEYHFGDYVLGGLLYYINMVPSFFSPFFSPRVKTEKKREKLKPIMLGIVLAFPMAILAIYILSKADLVFRSVIQKIFGNIFFSVDFFFVLLLGVFGFFLFFAFVYAAAKEDLAALKRIEKEKKDSLIAITFSSVLCGIYLLFSFVQIGYLFIGNLKLPDGITYAAYAKKGFYELLWISILNVILVVVCSKIFKRTAGLKAVLTVISLTTYCMIASALCRLLLYISNYHLTINRIIALWVLAVITVVMTGVILSIYIERFGLFKFCMVTVLICYLCFAFSKPDYYIASYNIAHMEEVSDKDFKYLTHNLSLDAAPALLKLSDETLSTYTAYDNITTRFEINYLQREELVRYNEYLEKYYFQKVERLGEENYGAKFNLSIYFAKQSKKQFEKKSEYVNNEAYLPLIGME